MQNCINHEKRKFHVYALLAYVELQNLKNKIRKPIEKILDLKFQEDCTNGKFLIKNIIEILILCGRQGIAIRETRINNDLNSEVLFNNCNFKSIFEMSCNKNSKLKEIFKKSQKSKIYQSRNLK